ncbi:MAG: hypothetical protein AB7F09_18335 [Parvibaculaceae bacterium]
MTDPLQAVDRLVAEISGADGRPADICALIHAIDTLMYAVHFVDADASETGPEAPRADYDQTYETLKQRHAGLGYYWLALHSIIREGTEGELAIGDAIDDLADILIDLGEVRWIHEHADRRTALAALRARYDMHLWMHFHSLRQYLEEVKRDD